MSEFKIMLLIDYEPFRSINSMGLVTESKEEYIRDIIEPTYRLMDILERHNAKLTILMEIVFVIKLKQYMPEVYELIVEQLKSAIKRGHDVQMHFHPEWITVDLTTNSWADFKKEYQYLDKVPKDIARTYLRDGKDLIESICLPINSEYKLLGYRAGGYRIKPFSYSSELLKEIGIIATSDLHRADSNFFYCSSNNIEKVDSNSEFIQFPILGTKTKYFKRWSFDVNNGVNYIFDSKILDKKIDGFYFLTMIGHPKTVYSYDQIDKVFETLKKRKDVGFITFQKAIEHVIK